MNAFAVLLVTLFFFACLAFTFVAFTRGLGHIRQNWSRFASNLDLQLTGRNPWRPQVEGQVEGYPLKVETRTTGQGTNRKSFTRITVSGEGKVSPEVKIKPKGLLSGIEQFLSGNDVDTQDSEFDKQVAVSGDTVDATAVLDEHTRGLIRGLVNVLNARVERSDVTVEIPALVRSEAMLNQYVSGAIAIAQGLAWKGTPAIDHLLHNASHDSNPAVRLNNLKVMIAHYPVAHQTLQAARRLINDVGSPETQLTAAISLRQEGLPTLVSLATSIEAPGPIRAHALTNLASQVPVEETLAVTSRIVSLPAEPVVVQAVANILGSLPSEAALFLLLQQLKKADGGSVRTIATALAIRGEARAQTGLLSALEGELNVDNQIAIIDALGKLGELRVVEYLLPFSKGVLQDYSLKNSARRAIASIQARHGGGEAGTLSITNAEEDGALSMSVQQGGLALDESAGERPRQAEDELEVAADAEVTADD